MISLSFESVSGAALSLFATLLIVIASRLYSNHRASVRPLPPGPPGLPFFGNALQVPSQHFATYMQELHSRYGGLVYLNFNRECIFSIGDIELALELLDRCSAIYSSRPSSMPSLNRYADPEGVKGWSLSQRREPHLLGRKLSVTVMKQVRAGHSEPLQRLVSVVTLKNIIGDEGKDWYGEINRMVARITVVSMLGIDSITNEAPEVAKMLSLIKMMVHVTDTSYSIINLFPVIDDLIPAFFPTPWRRNARNWAKVDSEGWENLFREALRGECARKSSWASMFAGADREGGAGLLLLPELGVDAIETTANALHSFVLACISFPEWISTAQSELDRVVGHDRSPSFEDRPLLPFIDAVVREVLRWSPPGRMGIPHCTAADDVVKYQGKEYFIPKGSTIFCSPFVMEYDPNRYENPKVFRPQRFLDGDGQLKADYQTSTFGFGRHACIGVPYVERTLWISIAAILWAFNLRKTVDPRTGVPFKYGTDDAAFNGGITNEPYPFPVRLEPRSVNRISVIQQEWEDSDKDLNVLLPPLKE